MYSGLVAQILSTETIWGPITYILVPGGMIEEMRTALTTDTREDLSNLVLESEDQGAMVVHAGGRDWRYGGL